MDAVPAALPPPSSSVLVVLALVPRDDWPAGAEPGGFVEEALSAPLPKGAVDAVTETDGVDASPVALGSAFPFGVFIAQDNANPGNTQNFKLVPWERVANAFDAPLRIESLPPPPTIASRPRPPRIVSLPAPPKTRFTPPSLVAPA